MSFTLPHTVAILERTPAVLRAWLGGLGEEWTHANYGEKTFSPFDVVGHLLHGEKTDWLGRAKLILEHGEAVPFTPFDRYALYEDSKGKTLNELLDSFAELRAKNLAELRAMKLTPPQLDLRGTHPALGTVTLRQLLATWAVHDLNHLHQIAKAMAYQYREEVGPWKEYLSILPRGAGG